MLDWFATHTNRSDDNDVVEKSLYVDGEPGSGKSEVLIHAAHRAAAQERIRRCAPACVQTYVQFCICMYVASALQMDILMRTYPPREPMVRIHSKLARAAVVEEAHRFDIRFLSRPFLKACTFR